MVDRREVKKNYRGECQHAAYALMIELNARYRAVPGSSVLKKSKQLFPWLLIGHITINSAICKFQRFWVPCKPTFQCIIFLLLTRMATYIRTFKLR